MTRVFSRLLAMKGVLSGLLALSLSGPLVAAEDLLSQIRHQLQTPPVLRGQFQQSKQLAGFSKALRSEGHFLVARARGVYWITDRPFASQMLLTPTRLEQRSQGQSSELSTDAQPGLAQVNRLIFALLAGNLAELEQRFELQPVKTATGWQLNLTPKAEVRQVLSRVELDGDQLLRQIRLTATSGDQTRIDFIDVQPGEQLTPAEEQHFD